ncbi:MULTISPECIES: 4-amino-4-deoxy-L-arabinose-phosphoundecaprenol flippase subunit ArnE [Pseudomonas syringae group]|uniref:Probable 4-amino-4-deoxy-L-arabinose-phosphoundecaprenol flippase subunit ArnE n=1 Tax=Pseudomonas tremae TaxID=200454 RepID=A0AA40P1N0_9PSED|nr:MULTISPECIES: 4-amino-4-deoxy-L-arabinose-phosphoundecaprenol flippase subunit ArnE [Pseudomonas syringae group]KPX30413.1 putative 4-amino-4-deoxy-L-arabinose-phosphoundecaprenol flippase subunit ArnE [Pseudomonas coronafaciens pv. garcae]KPY92325.1 putative 4-amino-4-deoxy-L-arabinose-phosphoundecaprenol flippase subunit ArnE [Pseudomonas tremae]KPZ25840.1 putative 4-amino-4-deoxy-L-arabinose-phosphoundecaprenol flippase subunit ArnE [Pseudomonas coronafaciens pv. zizaniae]MCF5803797.1 Eam
MTALMLMTACLLTCLGQIAQKKAVESWRGVLPGLLLALRSGWLWLAITCLGLGLLTWLMVLQRMEVGVAYPMLGVNFVLITLVGRYVFKEPVDLQHWLGVALIVCGVVLLGSQA